MHTQSLLRGLVLFLSGLCLTFTEVQARNVLLRELSKEDQASRSGKEVSRTDEDRIKIVLSEIGEWRVQTHQDKFNAGPVLQHTPLTFFGEDLVSKSPDNYLLAHCFFKSAFEAGYKDAGYLTAASIDRYLSFTEGRQKYGTNVVINRKTGKDELVPINRSTTDGERDRYGVPPLADLLKQFPEQSSTDKPNP